jgi:GR25 family glycosyltransferase involved in LPS biosynthesis
MEATTKEKSNSLETDALNSKERPQAAPMEPLTTKSIHFYCINLKHRTDRWTAFSQQPAIQEIRKDYVFERFDAVAGSTLDIQNDNRISLRAKRNIKDKMRRDHEDLNTAGAIGCYLSHVEIWRKVVNNPEPYAVVFEDDAAVPADFLKRLEFGYKEWSLLPGIPDVWTFSNAWPFYYQTKGRPLPQDVPENRRGYWVLNTGPGGTGGYLITKEGAKKLLETAFPIDIQVDLYICLCSEMKKIRCVSNTQLTLGSLSEGTKSDIQLPSGCAICDVPTNMNERGLTLVNVPLVVFGLCAMAGIAWISGGSRSKR